LLGFRIATLAALLGFIIVQEAEQSASALVEITATAALRTVLAFPQLRLAACGFPVHPQSGTGVGDGNKLTGADDQ
jgi:hypothetical protein